MSFSVAYSMKRKNKKCHGGKMAEGGPVISQEDAEKFKKGANFAKGGMAEHQSECTKDCNQPCEVHENDMVNRIMAKRMSEGGMVANEDMPEADFDLNEFDDLHLRDDLEFKETGANSGDELGDAVEDERRKDRVMRIMMKRSKQHNPVPA